MVTMIEERRVESQKLSYFREIQQELRHVSWPSKEELKTSTKVVISATFLFGVAIYVVDLALKGGLELIGALARYIGG